MKKLQHFLKPKCHALFLDAALNSVATICANVHKLTVLCAAKLCCYARAMRQHPADNDAFAYRLVSETVAHLVRLVNHEASRSIALFFHGPSSSCK